MRLLPIARVWISSLPPVVSYIVTADCPASRYFCVIGICSRPLTMRSVTQRFVEPNQLARFDKRYFTIVLRLPHVLD